MVNAGRSLQDEPSAIAQLTRMDCVLAGVRNAEWIPGQDTPAEAELLALQQLLEQEAREPILLTMIASLVLVLALGIFLPMWSLGQAAMGRG